MGNPAILSWSGGKDCALALHEVIESGSCKVVSLLSTLSERYDRVSMHGIRRPLVEAQAESIGIPIRIVTLPAECSDREYEERMLESLREFRESGVRDVIFGDVFLQDVREYRERNLSGAGMRAGFPLWGKETARLADDLIDLGFRAITTCVDTGSLDRSLAGRLYDRSFIEELPKGVDPCGENGEFHTFVFDGPVFSDPVGFEVGEKVLRDGRFYFCDLVPK